MSFLFSGSGSNNKDNMKDQQQKVKDAKKDAAEKLMAEVSEELGIDVGSKSIKEDKDDFVQRMKKAIKKRT